VFTVQPTVSLEGMDPTKESASVYADVSTVADQGLNPATVTVGIVALGIVAVAGSATAVYYEVRHLVVLWLSRWGPAGTYTAAAAAQSV